MIPVRVPIREILHRQTEIEDFASTNDAVAVLVTHRRFLGAAGLGLGFAGLIRTQDVFSMAHYGWIPICPPGEPAYPFLVHLTGMKTHDPSRMPLFIRTQVMESFPDRFL